MSMNGLNKITDKILAEAHEEADRVLAEARQACDTITADAAIRADEIRERLFDDAEIRAAKMIAEAKSFVASKKQDRLLEVKSRLVNEAFERTRENYLQYDVEKYSELLGGLLCAAVLEQAKAEKRLRSESGDDHASETDPYEVSMNRRDLDRFGKNTVEHAVKKLSGKLSQATLARIVLCEQPEQIDGGLILRCANVELDYSLSHLFDELKQKLASDVYHALFDARWQR